jgi:hypothetical protein
VEGPDAPEESRRLTDEWFLGPVVTATFEELGLESGPALRKTVLVKLLSRYEDILEAPTVKLLHDRLALVFGDDEASRFLGVNEYEDVFWFSRDAFHELMLSLLLVEAIKANGMKKEAAAEAWARLEGHQALALALGKASERSGYTVARFLEIVRDETEV